MSKSAGFKLSISLKGLVTDSMCLLRTLQQRCLFLCIIVIAMVTSSCSYIR